MVCEENAASPVLTKYLINQKINRYIHSHCNFLMFSSACIWKMSVKVILWNLFHLTDLTHSPMMFCKQCFTRFPSSTKHVFALMFAVNPFCSPMRFSFSLSFKQMHKDHQRRLRRPQIHYQRQTVCQVCGGPERPGGPNWHRGGHESRVRQKCYLNVLHVN